jgi:hypothetical protein
MLGKKRPVGITVLTILNIIIGIADLISFLFLGSLMGSDWLQFGAISGLIGGILVLQGIVLFVLAYGFLGGKSWAWILGLIFGIWDITIGIILLPAGIIRIIYGAVIIGYLSRRNVKEFFGKVASTSKTV